MVAFIIFFLILSILIIIHELGHFIAAKKSGVTVEEFGLGYPPRIFGKKIKGTIYSINLIPFGGFVRILGSDYEDYNPKDKRNFASKPPSRKFVILIAGVLMNLALSVLLYFALFLPRDFTSLPIILFGDFNFKFGEVTKLAPVVVYTEKEETPFKIGDRVLSISYVQNRKVESIKPKNLEDVTRFISNKKDATLRFIVENIQTNEKRKFTAKTHYDSELKRNVVGIGIGKAVQFSYKKPYEKVLSPFLHSMNILSYSYNVFQGLYKTSRETKNIKPVASSFTGPVGVFFIVESILKIGGKSAVLSLVDFVALLSLSLAIMNILPLPALDGGHLVFVIYEAITKKHVPVKIMKWVSSVGMAFIIVLAILISFKDFLMFR